MTTWSPLVHRFLRWNRDRDIQNKKLLLLVSGGSDSMALAAMYDLLQKPLRLELHVLHIHHGVGPTSRQTQFRSRAQTCVQKFCAERKIPFRNVRVSKGKNPGETEARNFRRKISEKQCSENASDWIVTAHTRDDVLETRLIRLLRGTGSRGLPAIREMRPPWLRPFLTFSKGELQAQLELLKVKWVEDPSNHGVQNYRAWLRTNLFPQLESFRPGSLAALARSLELLAQNAIPMPVAPPATNIQFSLPAFLRLERHKKTELIHGIFAQLNRHHFSGAHIEEIAKRLSHFQARGRLGANIRFTVAGLTFGVTDKRIVHVHAG